MIRFRIRPIADHWDNRVGELRRVTDEGRVLHVFFACDHSFTIFSKKDIEERVCDSTPLSICADCEHPEEE